MVIPTELSRCTSLSVHGMIAISQIYKLLELQIAGNGILVYVTQTHDRMQDTSTLKKII